MKTIYSTTMLVCLLMSFVALPLQAQEQRSLRIAGNKGQTSLTITDHEGQPVSLYGASYALLIGISRYTHGWPSLGSVPGEMEQVEGLLKEQGFGVIKHLDLKADEMKYAFEDFINQYGFEPQNRLLFFFSGHGHTRQQGEKGYLVPADAPDPLEDEKGFLQKALSMTQILAWARQIEAKHAMFLFDSCFSGTVFKSKALPEHPPHISELTTLPVRQFMTAGGENDTVPAQSVFTPVLIDALQFGLADLDGDGYITGTELGLYLRRIVPQHTDQVPQYGRIRDYELSRGDFVFVSELKQQQEILSVTSNVPDTTVLIDGENYGSTPVETELVVGWHTVRVEKEGYEFFQRNIDLRRPETIRATLRPVAVSDVSSQPESEKRSASDMQQTAKEEKPSSDLLSSPEKDASFSDTLKALYDLEKDVFETEQEFQARRQKSMVEAFESFQGKMTGTDMLSVLTFKPPDQADQGFREYRQMIFNKMLETFEGPVTFSDILAVCNLSDATDPKFEEYRTLVLDKFLAVFNQAGQTHDPEYQVGVAALQKDGYDIETEKFPLKIAWQDWGIQLAEQTQGYILIPRDEARDLWEEGPQKPVYLTLEVTANTPQIRQVLLASSKKEWEVAPLNWRELRTLEGHNAKVNSVAFSPNAQLLASGADYWDPTIKVWQIATGELLHTLEGHKEGVRWIAFHPKGDLLASGSYDKTVKLWDVNTGELVYNLEGHEEGIRWLAFHPKGHLLASGSYDSSIKLWDVNTGELLNTLQGHNDWLGSVAFSPDGKILASGGGDKIINLWDLNTGKIIRTLQSHQVYTMTFSPDGRILASGSGDKTINLWDVSTNTLLQTLKDHQEAVQSVAFSPDGQTLASGSSDKTIKVWKVNTEKPLYTLQGHQDEVYATAFSPDGLILASGSWDKTIKLWTNTW